MTSPARVRYRLTPTPGGDPTPFQPRCQARISLYVKPDTKDADPYLDLCDRVTSYFDPNLDVFRVNDLHHYENVDDMTRGDDSTLSTTTNSSKIPRGSGYPAFCVMVFLRSFESDAKCGGPVSSVHPSLGAVFDAPPWKLHHREHVRHCQGKTINPVKADHHEFVYTSSHLPLWGLRHVHYGREHIRFVLCTSHNLWDDQVQFYSLLLGLDPDLLREDFCLYTVQSDNEKDYDVQFSLKRLPENKTLNVLDQFHLQVKVKDIGQLVPLFPNICRPLTDVIWRTKDHDGNYIFLDVVRTRQSHIGSSNGYFNIDNSGKNNISSSSNNQSNIDDEDSSNIRYANEEEVVYSNHCSDFIHDDNDDDLHRAGSALDMPVSVARKNLGRSSNNNCDHDDSMLTEFDDVNGDKDTITNPATSTTVLCNGQSTNIFLFTSGSEPRGGSLPDEDEESLTLTNTSEESGIQVFHDESTSGDNEGHSEIRPCLSKAGSKFAKNRPANRRVRFSDEIEAFEFEDDSISRLSSGFESDEQSDVEIVETRFPAFPPTFGTGADTGTSGYQSSANVPPNGFLPRNNRNGDIERSRSFTDATSFNSFDADCLSYEKESDNNIKPGSFSNSKQHLMGIQKSSSFHMGTDFHHSNPHVGGGGELQSVCVGGLPTGDSTCKRKPPSYEAATKRLAELANKGKSKSNSPSPNIFVSFGKTGHSDHLSSPSLPSSSSCSHKNLPRCATPMIGQAATNQIDASHDVTMNDNVTRVGERMVHRQQHSNSTNERTTRFHRTRTPLTNSDPHKDNGSSLNFNLRFDTCPMAGGKPREEQIGFFV